MSPYNKAMKSNNNQGSFNTIKTESAEHQDIMNPSAHTPSREMGESYMLPHRNRLTTETPGHGEGQRHLQNLFSDIAPRQQPVGPPALPIFPAYDQFNPNNRRDDDDTFHLGFEVTREKVRLSEKSLAYRPTPRSPPLREITRDEFRTAVDGARTGKSDALANGGQQQARLAHGSAAAPIRGEVVRGAAGAGTGLDRN